MITEEDYVIAWDAVSADTASDASVQRFCADNCLTQSVVLNVPSAENIEDLREMCSDIEIEEFPFIDAMVFANLIEENNGTVVALGMNASLGPPRPPEGIGRTSSAAAVGAVGIEVMVVASVMWGFAVLCL